MVVGATTYRRKQFKMGRRKRRSAAAVFNSMIGSSQKYVWRWQNISPNLLNPGRLPLGWNIGTSTDEWVPIHLMSLTSFPLGNVNTAKGCDKNGIKRMYYDPLSGNFNYQASNCQASSGIDSGANTWHLETGYAHTDGRTDPEGKVYHSWTDIRLNLYGTMSVPITYSIYVIQVPEALDVMSFGGSTISVGSECANFLKDLVRPLCGNPLNMNGRIDWPKDVRILKKIVRTIQPLSYSDQAATKTDANTAHVEQVKCFLRHDRFRDYRWSENVGQQIVDTTLNTQGWDTSLETSVMCDVEWGKRVYLMITATSPFAEGYDAAYQNFVDAQPSWLKRQGSYDIIVRNKFSTFR